MRRGYQRVELDPFATRLPVLVGVAFLILILISLRLFTKSVVAHDATLAIAEQQYLVRQAVEPKRGTIYATDAEAEYEKQASDQSTWAPIARNQLTYALSVVPRNMKDKWQAAEQLASWAELSPAELFEKINNDKYYLPPLRKGLSEEQKNQVKDLHLAGIFFTEENDRLYPEGSLASQILGFVNAEDVGSYGLEQWYHNELRGKGGEVIAERDAHGRFLSPQDETPVKDGQHLVLTLDRNVQGFVEKTLKKAIETYQADSGSIVVLDVRTGGVVAMANAPDFNPNQYRALSKDEVGRFVNPSVASVWEPGSIFKTLVMAAAIDAGLIEPETEEVFSNQVIVDGYTINTAENKAFGRETMTQVLENSDNVAMVWIADKLGNEQLHKAIRSFGFGEALGIDLPGEVGGQVPALKNWHNTTRATLSFGQGISTTPLQMTAALATIANGGKLMKPYIVQKILDPSGTVLEKFEPTVVTDAVLKPETATKVATMMVSVVENGHGKRAKVPGYKIAGKTGTAQIPDSEQGGYVEGAHIGGFGGFFPADNPQFAMVVKLDRPKTVKFAESSAAPTFGEVAQFMLHYYRIPPTEPVG